MMPQLELRNKWVFIAGSAEPDGIGRAAARKFAQDMGANLILHGRRSSRKKLEIACAELKHKYNVEAMFVTADFLYNQEIDKMFDEITRNAEEIWALINSVGLAYGWNKDEDKVLQEEWDKTTQIIVYAARQCIDRGSLLMPTGGRIVNIGSIGADVPWPKAFPYRKAKQQLHDLTNEQSDELKKRGILLNCIKPGLVDTRQTRKGGLLDRAYYGQFSQAVQWLTENFRSDVMLSPDEIACQIIQYCNVSSQAFGENVTLDKGLTAFWNRNHQAIGEIFQAKKAR